MRHVSTDVGYMDEDCFVGLECGTYDLTLLIQGLEARIDVCSCPTTQICAECKDSLARIGYLKRAFDVLEESIKNVE